MPARLRPWWLPKPYQNRRGVIPVPLFGNPRKNKIPLIPKVQNLVQGAVIPKPLWLDAALAHPPPPPVPKGSKKPQKFQWREEDLLRRTWQRRNPEAASTFAKVLFLDESSLPSGTPTEHPADEFVRKQMALMRRGMTEEEAYRRVQHQVEQKRRVGADDVAAARAQASAFGATPFEPPSSGTEGGGGGGGGGGGSAGSKAPAPRGFAEQLLRRFAEEARDGKQPYPEHWFNSDGSWRGIGDPATELTTRTVRALNRAGRSAGVLETVTFRSEKAAEAAAAEAEAESKAAAEAPDDEAPDEPKGQA